MQKLAKCIVLLPFGSQNWWTILDTTLHFLAAYISLCFDEYYEATRVEAGYSAFTVALQVTRGDKIEIQSQMRPRSMVMSPVGL
jgi:hypothetical protein